MKYRIHSLFQQYQKKVLDFVIHFDSKGEVFVKGKRNEIKLFDLNGKTINIKSFKTPHFINKVIYSYFRKSKARRSFEFATILLEKGIGTPQPILFLENYNCFGLTSSFYASEHLKADLTFRELVEIPDFPEHEKILRQFTKFCFDLHEQGIEFLDHSPGNTLIKRNNDGNYSFYLVDLNRMNFHQTMGFDLRMKNMSRLTPKNEMVQLMSKEYSKWYAVTEEEVFDKMWQYTHEFQNKFAKKQQLKKRLKFWKA